LTKKAGNSLERVLAVLEVFSEERLEWTPEELMEKLGYSRPTLYRYLKTLKEAGLLTSMPNAGFTLGPKVVEMDYLMRKSDRLILNGSAQLKSLTARYSCTALLVRWYGDKLLCVDSESSTRNPLSSYPRGRPMPLGRGAIARSIMAFLPRRHLVPLVERMLKELQQVGLGATVEEVLDHLKSVKRAGVAVAYGEVTPGVVGIAAPVFDAGQSPVASVCVTIAGNLVKGDDIEQIATDIKAAAHELSLSLSRGRLESVVS
jgi:DNA-binding IclR family transcriptional regulator